MTFAGQFLDHDMTFDEASPPGVPTAPEQARNTRTPGFDLDSVYGAGPSGSPQLYDAADRDKFRVQSGGLFEDLPRNANGTAIITDPRNDENLVIAGLHAAFLLFHNRVVDRLREQGQTNVFAAARQLVRWHYQWLILQEILPSFAGQPLVTDILRNGRRIYWRTRVLRFRLRPGRRRSGRSGRPAWRGPRATAFRRLADVLLLRGTAGPAWQLVTAALLAGGVPVGGQSASGSLVVLVDPADDDWPVSLPVVLVRSGPPRRAEVLAALLQGARTVMTAERVPTDLVPACTLATRGYVTVDPDATCAVLDAVRAPSAAPGLPDLTSRELDILELVATGHTVRQTARALGIAEKTMENTQSRLYRKLGARNRSGALVAAHALGLLEHPEPETAR